MALTPIQKVLVSSEPRQQMKSLMSWADSGSLMAVVRSQQAKMVLERGMFWIILHTNKHSQFMGNCHHLISSLVPSSLKDGLSFRVKVKLCKHSADKAIKLTSRSKRMKRDASKITRGVRIVATWHHKNHCHSKVSLPPLKNSAIERPKRFKNKYLYQV